MEENIARSQQFYRQNSPISYLYRQFNDQYINSFIINVYFRRYIFQGWIWIALQLQQLYTATSHIRYLRWITASNHMAKNMLH